jgi:hypothetical protein
MNAIYKYPVNNASAVMAVLEPMLEPDLFDAQNLYTNLDTVRNVEYYQRLKATLGIINNEFLPRYDYKKIIFSGHIGSGKSAELARLHNDIKDGKPYFSVFISIEQETEYSKFVAEDFYSLLVLQLVKQLKAKGITNIKTEALTKLANIFFEEKEIQSSKPKNTMGEVSIAPSVDIFDGLFKFSTEFKTNFSDKTQVSTITRQKVRNNLQQLIDALNELLIEVRSIIKRKNLGEDLIFIVDGSEKIKFEIYEQIFITDASQVQNINANMVVSIPIRSFYKIEASAQRFTTRFTLPMVPLYETDDHNTLRPAVVDKFAELLFKRIDKKYMPDTAVLQKAVKFSGGSVRQFFHIVHEAFMNCLMDSPDHQVIQDQHVQKAIETLGQQSFWEKLNEEEVRYLIDKFLIMKLTMPPADEISYKMLTYLVLLKYNGTSGINPLLMQNKYFRQWIAQLQPKL